MVRKLPHWGHLHGAVKIVACHSQSSPRKVFSHSVHLNMVVPLSMVF